jgi:hypothetical protein
MIWFSLVNNNNLPIHSNSDNSESAILAFTIDFEGSLFRCIKVKLVSLSNEAALHTLTHTYEPTDQQYKQIHIWCPSYTVFPACDVQCYKYTAAGPWYTNRAQFVWQNDNTALVLPTNQDDDLSEEELFRERLCIHSQSQKCPHPHKERTSFEHEQMPNRFGPVHSVEALAQRR